MSKLISSLILISIALFLLRALSISKREVRFDRRPKNRWQALTENIDPTLNSRSSSKDVSQGKKEEEKNG